MNRIIILIFLTCSSINIYGQKPLLENSTVLTEVKKCLFSTYNYEFNAARESLKIVESYSPDHPAVKFLKALIIYWEYYPLVPGNKKEPEFLDLLESCIKNSENWVKKDPDELEAIFFDLFSRAFYVMYWADNGKPGKVFPHINTLYKHTMEGFERKEEFNEFYFTTGLYNYYIKAYPEKHPAYKPIVLFFKEGNLTLGLDQLRFCAENSVFLRVEAKFFLSLLYLNYEKDPGTSSVYAAELYREFPNNTFYTGKYLEILLYNHKYFFAPFLLEHLKKWDNDPFSQMQYHLYNGFYQEKRNKNYSLARTEYEKALEISGDFKDFTKSYNAIAYMGLGRYYQREGNLSLANKYFRQAKIANPYDYILEDR